MRVLSEGMLQLVIPAHLGTTVLAHEVHPQLCKYRSMSHNLLVSRWL